MEDKVFVKRSVTEQPFYMMPVEIIIPYHNQLTKVANLLADIFSTVTTNRYLITLVDDGSINNTLPEQIKDRKLEGIRILSHDKCKGFGAAVNTALKNPFSDQIPYVLILHSDVSLKDLGWLQNLGTSLIKMKSEGVKMISPTTNNPVADFDCMRATKAAEKSDLILNGEYLPMYAALCHRELFSRVGLMAEYPYAGVEVEEFADRMRKNNFRQAVCGSSWIYHEGGASLSHFADDKKVQAILTKTRQEYLSKKSV